MAMKQTGDQAPAFHLKDLHGRTVSLSDLRKQAPVLLVFFKVECPTCQYTLPFVERLHQALRNVSIVGISQNPAAESAAFAKRFNLTLPILLDENDYPASRAYAITTVPSLFLVNQDGEIAFTAEGWVKEDFQKLIEMMKPAFGPAPVVFKPNESVQDFKAG